MLYLYMLIETEFENYIANNPSVNLLHGDLWSGNILFNDGKLDKAFSFSNPF